jgi:hypothetical protein
LNPSIHVRVVSREPVRRSEYVDKVVGDTATKIKLPTLRLITVSDTRNSNSILLPDHLIGRIADSESAHLGSTPSWAANLVIPNRGLQKQTVTTHISALSSIVSLGGTMGRIFLLVLLSVLTFGAYKHGSIEKHFEPFDAQARAATGAIFVDKDRRFNCSGTEVGHTPDGDGVFLTARHCVADTETNKINKHIVVSFTNDEGGPFYDADPVAISLNDDLALLLLTDGASIPEISVRDQSSLHNGDAIFNVSFPLDMGKQEFHGKFLSSRMTHVPDAMLLEYPFWANGMLFDMTVAPGSSGSGLFSAKHKALIGVAVGMTGAAGYDIAIPADIVINFLNDLKDNTVDKFVAANPEKPASLF